MRRKTGTPVVFSPHSSLLTPHSPSPPRRRPAIPYSTRPESCIRRSARRGPVIRRQYRDEGRVCFASCGNRLPSGPRRRPSPPPCRIRAFPSPAKRSRFRQLTNRPRSARLRAAALRSTVRPACGSTASHSRRGRWADRTAASCFFPDAAVSRRRCSSRSDSFQPGNRSISRASDFGCGWPLTTRLRSRTTGPDKPKWANRSDPRPDCRTVFPSTMRTPTSGSVTPRSSVAHGASMVIGTRAGRGGTMVWPRRRTKA